MINKAALGMAILETKVVAVGGKTFAEGCYILEGDSCIILRAVKVLKRIVNTIQNNETFDEFGDNVKSFGTHSLSL